MRIGVAIPTFDRFKMTLRCFESILDDERVAEVVIVDDASDVNVYADLKYCVAEMRKVILHRNERNKDCYFNKKAAIELSLTEWVLLADSDNVFGADYLDALSACQPFEPDTIYAPVFAKPHFDYRAFSDFVLSRENVSLYLDYPMLLTALNTANYVVHRETFLKCWDGSIDPITADSIFHNYNHLKAGGKIKFVPNLEYEHTVHPMSHYKLNAHRSGSMHMHVEQLLKNLK